MSGPGFYKVTAICPDCFREVACEVLVTSAGEAHTVSGPDEHRALCPRWREEK